jgi:hypothetical protein
MISLHNDFTATAARYVGFILTLPPSGIIIADNSFGVFQDILPRESHGRDLDILIWNTPRFAVSLRISLVILDLKQSEAAFETAGFALEQIMSVKSEVC